jgi:hypothetical protein
MLAHLSYLSCKETNDFFGAGTVELYGWQISQIKMLLRMTFLAFTLTVSFGSLEPDRTEPAI